MVGRSGTRMAVLVGLVGLGVYNAGPALAVPTGVSHVNLPTCDALAVPPVVDELGDTPAFPPDERIVAVDLPGPGAVGCPSTDTPAPNVLISMTNITTLDFVEVWYVADPETSISNVDGLVNGEEAFRIDAVGLNAPLVFESISVDGVFEAGETWDFIIDDWSNALGLAADDFFSIGVGGLSPGGPSTASIIAIIPEPATGLLVVLGLTALAARRAPRQP